MYHCTSKCFTVKTDAYSVIYFVTVITLCNTRFKILKQVLMKTPFLLVAILCRPVNRYQRSRGANGKKKNLVELSKEKQMNSYISIILDVLKVRTVAEWFVNIVLSSVSVQCGVWCLKSDSQRDNKSSHVPSIRTKEKSEANTTQNCSLEVVEELFLFSKLYKNKTELQKWHFHKLMCLNKC